MLVVLVVLEVLEVTVVTLHAAKTMVALAVIVNVTSGGGRVYGGCSAHAAEWDYNRGRKRLQPTTLLCTTTPPICQ